MTTQYKYIFIDYKNPSVFYEKYYKYASGKCAELEHDWEEPFCDNPNQKYHLSIGLVNFPEQVLSPSRIKTLPIGSQVFSLTPLNKTVLAAGNYKRKLKPGKGIYEILPSDIFSFDYLVRSDTFNGKMGSFPYIYIAGKRVKNWKHYIEALRSNLPIYTERSFDGETGISYEEVQSLQELLSRPENYTIAFATLLSIKDKYRHVAEFIIEKYRTRITSHSSEWKVLAKKFPQKEPQDIFSEMNFDEVKLMLPEIKTLVNSKLSNLGIEEVGVELVQNE